jgi:DNA-binding XRE family transcriptional regulator
MPASLPFGRWLKHLRTGLDLTQDELAEQVGCAAQTIRSLETHVTQRFD